MNAGIISAFKIYYRRFHLQSAVDRDERGDHNIYKIDQLTAMQWRKAAWEEVSAATVANCFRHTSLFEEETQLQVNEEEQGVEQELLDAMERLPLRIRMDMDDLLHSVEEVYTAHVEITDN